MTTRPNVPLTFHHEPKVWIGCLQCYNEGRLVGDWYPANEAGEITTSNLHGRPIRPETHEELWCLDVEGFPEAREMDPMTAQMWGDLYDEVGDAQWPAFCAWVRSGSHVEDGDGMPSASDFEERYAGSWNDFEEYAWNYVVSSGMQHEWTETARDYFDLKRYARDLQTGFTVEDDPDGGVFIFRDT